MAYMNQEKKAKLAPAIKAVLKKYNVKGSIGVRNHITLVVNISSGSIDFYSEFKGDTKFGIDVNQYWYNEHFKGISVQFLDELYSAMMQGNHDRSDIMSDYFDVG